jgi:anaerobic selenocysteine-containing dehydrogenase
MAVHALNALVGNINQAGGVWAVPEPDYFGWPRPEMDAVAATGMQQTRIDKAGSDAFPYSRSLLNRLAASLTSGDPAPLQLLFVAGANPAYSLPGSRALREALAKIPFVVSFSSFMDETAQQVDLLLPEHLYLERLEDIPVAAGMQTPVINLARPVVEPLFDTRHLGDVVLQMARALGGTIAGAFPWDDYETCLVETLGEKLDPLVENGFWFDPDFAPATWARAFDTPSGKFEFMASAAGNGSEKGVDVPPHFAPLELEGNPQEFPLILMPYDSMRLASGYVGSPPFLVKTIAETVLKDNAFSRTTASWWRSTPRQPGNSV